MNFPAHHYKQVKDKMLEYIHYLPPKEERERERNKRHQPIYYIRRPPQDELNSDQINGLFPFYKNPESWISPQLHYTLLLAWNTDFPQALKSYKDKPFYFNCKNVIKKLRRCGLLDRNAQGYYKINKVGREFGDKLWKKNNGEEKTT
jgi:hypothetical protein